MRAVTQGAHIVRHELRRRLRSRSALVTAFVAPLALAAVFSLLARGTNEVRFTIGLVDEDRSEHSEVLVAGMAAAEPTESSPIAFVVAPTRAAVDDEVLDDRVDAALIVSAGFGAATDGESGTVTIEVRRDPRKLVAGQVAAAIGASIVSHAARTDLAVRTVVAISGQPPSAQTIAGASQLGEAVRFDDAAVGARELDAAAYFGASMSILFCFFTVGAAARSLLAERRDGTLARLLSTPLAPGALLAGKTVAVSVLGLVGFAVVWLATTFAFGAEWGRPLPVALLMVAAVFAIGGVATLVGSLARSDAQADAYTSVTTFTLALLGGNFIGPGQLPPLLRVVGRLTPNGWALGAFTDLSVDAASIGSIAAALGVLGAIGLVCGSAGVWRLGRVIGR